MSENRANILMIHLPDDVKKLRAVIGIWARELEQLNSTVFDSVYEKVVEGRIKEPKEVEKFFDRAERTSVFCIPQRKHISRIKKDFAKFEKDHPEFKPLLNAMVKCVLSLKGKAFTYNDFRKALFKQLGVTAQNSEALKELVYAFLKSSGIPKVMKYDLRTRRLAATFNVQNFDERDGLV